MTDIFQKIKEVSKRRLILPSILGVIMAVILILCPFINIFHPKTVDNIFNVTDSDSYVSVTADTLYYTGYNLVKPGFGEFGYYYALEDNKCIFVIIPVDSTPETIIYNYNFKAKSIKPDKTYRRMLSAYAEDLNWTADALSDTAADFVLSNANYHPVIYMFFLWIVLIILFISLKNLVFYTATYINPSLYPVCTFLGRHAGHELIEKASRELDSGRCLQINSMYITENYFIELSKLQVSVIPLKEIVWCYRLGKISLNPKRKEPVYTVCFVILNGSTVYVKYKTSDEALGLIDSIHATEHNIILGHSHSKRKQAKKVINEYEKKFNKKRSCD